MIESVSSRAAAVGENEGDLRRLKPAIIGPSRLWYQMSSNAHLCKHVVLTTSPTALANSCCCVHSSVAIDKRRSLLPSTQRTTIIKGTTRLWTLGVEEADANAHEVASIL